MAGVVAGIQYDFGPGQFLAAFTGQADRIGRAAAVTIREATNLARKAGRAAIAAGGFSSRWQTALRSKIYPSGRDSAAPVGFVYHRYGYASVFERGTTIAGKPMLWLPIEANLPKGRRGRSWTPRQYVAQFGPLVSVNVPGRPPMLFGVIKVGRRSGKVLPGRRQTAPGGVAVFKPLFVGVTSVTEPKKYDVTAAIRGVQEQIPELFRKNLAQGR